ncbi:MAG: hypothetical protein KA447_04340 [Pyrinomonadaceae bacterium]|nr:hypothetical protein [Pyrinomonadaceae bacterium]
MLLTVLFATGLFSGCRDRIENAFDPRFFEDGASQGASYLPVNIYAIENEQPYATEPIGVKAGNLVYVGGQFESVAGVAAKNIAVFNKTTKEWAALTEGGLRGSSLFFDFSHVDALKVQGEYLYVGGEFSQTVDGPVTGIANVIRYHMPSKTWQPLPTGVNGTVRAIESCGNKLYFGGDFTSSTVLPVISLKRIAVYDPSNSSMSPLLNDGLNGSVHAISCRPSSGGTVLVGGEFTQTTIASPPGLSRIALYDPAVPGWSAIGTGLDGTVRAIESCDPDSAFLVGGDFTRKAKIYSFLNSNWSELPNNGVNNTVYAVACEPGLIGVGGSFTSSGDEQAPGMAHIGILADNSWRALAGNGLNGIVRAFEVDSSYIRGQNETGFSLIVGGSFTGTNTSSFALGGITNFSFSIDPALQPSGSTITSNFSKAGLHEGKALDQNIRALAADQTGKVYAGGYFRKTASGTQTLNRIARWDPAINEWSSLPGNGLNGDVEALIVVGNSMYVGGFFTATADGTVTNLNRIARYDLITNTWHPVGNNGLNLTVLSFAVKGNDLWVGGRFSRTFDSAVTNLNYLAQYNIPTNTWSAVPESGMNADVNSLLFVGNDLYLGGEFTRTFDMLYSVFGFTKLDTLTGIYTEVSNSGTNAGVDRIWFDGTVIYVSGQFTRTKDNTILLNGFGTYSPTGDSWSPVVTDTESFDNAKRINALVDVGTDRYMAGEFHSYGRHVSRFFTRVYNQQWSVLAPTTDWFNPANWTTNAVPATNSNVVIPVNSGTLNISSSDVVLGDLLINGGTLKIAAGRTLTINGVLRLDGGSITGDGTVVITRCKSDGIMHSNDTAYIRTSLVRCVDGTTTYNFPVGTANGYSPITIENITGTGNVSVKANQGAYSGPAMYLPANRLGRWWQIENPGGGVTNANLFLGYLDSDVSGTEGNYGAYRISGGIASGLTSIVNTFSNTVNSPNVTGFSDWTLAELSPTAANVSVGGRVITAAGNGIGKTVVTLTDQSGNARIVLTNAFGYYRFENVEAGQTYIIAAQSKRFQFTNPTQIISVKSDVTDADFVSSP